MKKRKLTYHIQIVLDLFFASANDDDGIDIVKVLKEHEKEITKEISEELVPEDWPNDYKEMVFYSLGVAREAGVVSSGPDGKYYLTEFGKLLNRES